MPLHDKSHNFISTILTFAKRELALPSLPRIKGCFLLAFALRRCVLISVQGCSVPVISLGQKRFIWCVNVALTAGCSSSDHHLCELDTACWKAFICGFYVTFALFVWKIQNL